MKRSRSPARRERSNTKFLYCWTPFHNTATWGGFLSHGGTPSCHPCMKKWDFHGFSITNICQPSSYWDTPISGNPHVHFCHGRISKWSGRLGCSILLYRLQSQMTSQAISGRPVLPNRKTKTRKNQDSNFNHHSSSHFFLNSHLWSASLKTAFPVSPPWSCVV